MTQPRYTGKYTCEKQEQVKQFWIKLQIDQHKKEILR